MLRSASEDRDESFCRIVHPDPPGRGGPIIDNRDRRWSAGLLSERLSEAH